MIHDRDDDDEDDELRTVLHVVDIQSGDILQCVPLELNGGDSATIIVDGDEIYIADLFSSEVVVLRIAGGPRGVLGFLLKGRS